MLKSPVTKDQKKPANPKEQKDKEAKVEEFPEMMGFGKFEFQNKIIYIGSYKQLTTGVKVREGHGKVIHPTNDNTDCGEEFYEGEWKNDKMEGFGIYHYSNGDVYEGDWADNMHNGFGKYYFTDGNRYEGDWKDHKMHGSGKFLDMNNLGFSGEFRDGYYISKDQAKLCEEKRIVKKISKMKEIPYMFYKSWEETFTKVDKKNLKEQLSLFFAKLENMGIYVKESYPKLEDKTPDKWNEALKFVFNQAPAKGPSQAAPKEAVVMTINIPKTASELIFMDKNSLLAPQLQEETSSGQVIEITTQLEGRRSNLAIGYSKDLNRWLIVHFSEIIEKKK